ncbi:hypothetical protein GUJ93_ZPchr0692g22920 [Zizania palustris]|uniref:Uncharacterized protein n=1 Tax=Zizania palustris TaxID=103762 RepID=A0A8J5RKE0_ZIZPA|nr:hypothetical protein GUJ93_ZPchr0692g22920 [Zizania palustris]
MASVTQEKASDDGWRRCVLLGDAVKLGQPPVHIRCGWHTKPKEKADTIQSGRKTERIFFKNELRTSDSEASFGSQSAGQAAARFATVKENISTALMMRYRTENC